MNGLLLSSELETYCRQHSSADDAHLEEVVRYTHTQSTQPQMISGPWQGSFLQMISQIVKPKYIVELGTFTGYSAIRLARGLSDGGKLVTIESNAETLANTQALLAGFPEVEQITFMQGGALDIIPTLADGIDLAFIDAKKSEYQDYYEAIVPKMQSGGVILIDNILWYGKVLLDQKDPVTQHLHELNIKVTEDHRVTNCLMPIRDGVMMVRIN